jgi:hypothetical protein
VLVLWISEEGEAMNSEDEMIQIGRNVMFLLNRLKLSREVYVSQNQCEAPEGQAQPSERYPGWGGDVESLQHETHEGKDHEYQGEHRYLSPDWMQE